MAAIALGHGQRVGYYRTAFTAGTTTIIDMSGYPPPGGITAGDRLFFWLDYQINRDNGASLVISDPGGGWTVAQVVGSGQIGTNARYVFRGYLYTKIATGDSTDYPVLTATAGKDLTDGLTVRAGAHLSGYHLTDGSTMTFVSSGQLESYLDNITPAGAVTGTLPEKCVVLSYGSHNSNINVTMLAANGFTLDDTLDPRLSPDPIAIPRVAPCRLRLASNLSAATLGPATIDGVVPANGDRILCTGLTGFYRNGIYVYNGSGVTMTRATDADTPAEMQRVIVDVLEGSAASIGRWSQYEDAFSLTTSAGRVLFVKSGGIPSNSIASRYNAAAGVSPLPQWQVAQGNDITEEHAGWSAWRIIDPTFWRRGSRVWAASVDAWV